MKFLLPYHLGSGNRGCEGIARGIANILNLDKNEMLLFETSKYDHESDVLLGIDDIGKLVFERSGVFEIKRKCSRLLQKIGHDQQNINLMAEYYVSKASIGDVILITGGDIYCYEGGYTIPNRIVSIAREKGIRTVLLGASLERKYLTEDVLEGIRKYDLIIARESITHDLLNQYKITNYLFPDPAFSLETESCELPDCFYNREIVGINISPYTTQNFLFKENLKKLVKCINNNGMSVCFIPHVFWKDQDDRETIKQFQDVIGENNFVLSSEKLSYLQIRYIISQCKYFIGGRTHSVISAYSTKVPTIALGYSVKSVGIAKDLGMPSYTVVDSKNLKNENELLEAFKTLCSDEISIKHSYENLPEYVSRSYRLRECVENVLE